MSTPDVAPALAADRSHAVQLGSFPLLDCPFYATINFPDCWCVLDPGFLEMGDWSLEDKETQDRLKTLRFFLRDPGVGVEAQYRRADGGFFVRVSVIPADAPGSSWGDPYGKGSRKANMRRLLGWITDDWEGEGNGKLIMGTNPDDANLSMRGIYTQLPDPPKPDFTDVSTSRAKDVELFSRLEGYEQLPGLKSTLRSYQMRSVAKMVRQELQPNTLVDLCCVPVPEAGREGRYYVNQSTYEIFTDPSTAQFPRGGILCEQMGVGKTLICLALILATLHQPCDAPPVDENTSLVVTGTALRTYPGLAYSRLRERLEEFPDAAESYKPIKPSLAMLCADVLARDDPSAANDTIITSDRNLRKLLCQTPFYYEFPIAILDNRLRNTRIDETTRSANRVYLSPATLVIVPAILLSQWRQEIDKHLEKNALRLCFVKAEDKMPELHHLLASDLVLLDVDKLGMEARKGSQSVLKQARWKRLLLDEGSLANQQTNVIRFARDLNIDRKWLITGTPTRNMHQGAEGETADIAGALPGGVQFSEGTKPVAEGSEAESKPTTSRDADAPLFANFDTGDEKPDRKADFEVEDQGNARTEDLTGWTKRDREDSNRFGGMLCNFLGADLFSLEGVTFRSVVSGKLCAKGGPSYGSVARMRELMENVMVKHRSGTVNEEIAVPPLTTVIQYLDLDPLQRTSYNALAALIAGNIYTVSAKSQGHFLHAKNKRAFQNVIFNLHLACFWYTSPEMNLLGSLEASQAHLNEAQMTEENRTLLEEAVQQLRSAIEDPVWSEWNSNVHFSLPFDASLLPEVIKVASTRSPNSNPNLVDAGMLLKLRNDNKGGVSLDELSTIAAIELAATSFAAQPTGKSKTSRGKKLDDGVSSQVKAPVPVSSETMVASRGKQRTTVHDVEGIDEQLQLARSNAAALRERPDHTDLPRPLPERMQTYSRSAKVNYVLHSILSAHEEDKFVIFGSVSEIGHLTEALDLADIKSCYVGAGVMSKIERRESLRKFEEPDVKVCMLELNLGARGLTMTLANRMIFLSPVWNLDVQAQAIKRIHRIGQTRPTKVEILVTRGTFEEEIARRETVSRTDEEEKLYSRAMVEKPRFVYTSHMPTFRFDARMAPHPPQAGDGEVVEVAQTDRKGKKRARTERSKRDMTPSAAQSSRPKKKAKTRFA
ncbi:SNF2 family N-terminal domain-domain-containing protein [Naematelia encephala]|uniref:SNF2 family N-terminal domain-domain-containing protein n=1 Tax=Naematelia encephala TaxID=71784 RepID=A0A1Y2BL34_9TREE|nr:SNF2 family N-terminal domain-domain-containing protein [Naematelia encephala]